MNIKNLLLRLSCFNPFRTRRMITIKCVACGLPISVNEPIALYSPSRFSDIPSYAVQFNDKLVGCMRANCAEKGTMLGGLWVIGKNGKGTVRPAPTFSERLKVEKRYREQQKSKPSNKKR